MTPQVRPGEEPKRPLLLTIIMAWFAIMSATAAVPTFMAATAHEPFSPGGEPVSRSVFFLEFTLPLALITVMAAVVAFGIWRHRRWARPLLVATYVVFMSYPLLWHYHQHDLTLAVVVRSVLLYGFLVAVLGWYLYAKGSVREYYEALENRR